MSAASRYARFRGSAWFVLFMCVFLAGWFVAEWIDPAFDRGFGILNVILSSEASLSVALLIMANERQDALQRKQVEYLLHLIEANHAVLVGCDAGSDDSPAHSCMVTDAEKL